MVMKKCVLFLPQPMLAEYITMSKRSGRSRSDLMRAALDEGIDVIQSKLKSEGTAQQPAKTGSSLGRLMSWSPPTPADWKAVSKIAGIVRALAEAHPEWDREAIRNNLSWRVVDVGFEEASEADVSRWSEIALDEILGPKGGERPRAAAGNGPPK